MSFRLPMLPSKNDFFLNTKIELHQQERVDTIIVRGGIDVIEYCKL